MTIDEAISHCLEVAEQKDIESLTDRWNDGDEWSESIKENCKQCAADHRQLAEWLTELKELRKLTVINPKIAGYNEVYEKLIKGDIEASNDKDLLKTAVETLENVMPKYKRLSEGNQKQKEQIAEYKWLLKAAVEDMTEMQFGKECKVCSKKLLPNECPIHNNVACILEKDFKWRYADEAFALIGEEGDTNG
jgi:hypothetical protein